MIRLAGLALVSLLCVACSGGGGRTIIDGSDPDGGSPDPDGGPDVDAGSSCECCGTTVHISGGETCTGGVCDPWCGFVDPCGGSCDFTENVCVFRSGGADAGPAPDGGTTSTDSSTCVPRPAECEDLANCGGPSPDPTCLVSDPCFEALDCAAQRVTRDGYLVHCLGA